MAGLVDYYQNVFSHAYGTGRGGGFSIIFEPMGFNYLFGVKSKDIFRHAIDGELIFGNPILDLWEQLQSFTDISGMKKMAEHFLLKQLKHRGYRTDVIGNIYSYMEKRDGMITVSQVCKDFNIHLRSFQRKFKEAIGLPPKEMLQILRLNKALRLLGQNADSDLSKISYLSGYYDQSHFTRDIRRITGITPGKIIKEENPERFVADNIFFIKTG
jgi:AraC-like DNA-binding protein